MEEEKRALAIKREEDGTQRIIAYGTGKDAEAIIEKAREHNVEVIQDPGEIDRILKEEEKGVVPERIYGLISEVVSFVTELNEAWVRKDFTGEEKPSESIEIEPE